MNASCQCGAIAFTIPYSQPIGLYHCHCIDCRKQSGSAYGTSAVFKLFELPKDDHIGIWTRTTDSGRTMDCYFCKVCGTRIMNKRREVNTVSMKGGILEGLDWTKGVHIWTKRAVIPIPDGKSWEGEPPDD